MENPIKNRPVHSDFLYFLNFKEDELVKIYHELRNYIFNSCPDCNELLYHTHALTSVYSLSAKLSDAFCHIPIYSKHLNLGFNKGALLDDPNKLLVGTGKLIRHIKIEKVSEFKNAKVKALIKTAINYAREDMEIESPMMGKTISKIKL